MAADKYVIEVDTRDRPGGALLRMHCFDHKIDALRQWNKIEVNPDPSVQWWLVQLRNGIDDPAHADCLECKCVG